MVDLSKLDWQALAYLFNNASNQAERDEVRIEMDRRNRQAMFSYDRIKGFKEEK